MLNFAPLVNNSCVDMLSLLYVNTHFSCCPTQSDNLHKLPGGRDLPGADYRDITKPVRRMLRQLGSGNLTAGVASLQSDDVALGELARLLEVSGQALALELHQVRLHHSSHLQLLSNLRDIARHCPTTNVLAIELWLMF